MFAHLPRTTPATKWYNEPRCYSDLTCYVMLMEWTDEETNPSQIFTLYTVFVDVVISDKHNENVPIDTLCEVKRLHDVLYQIVDPAVLCLTLRIILYN